MTVPDRYPGLLAATAMGVYLLLVVGAATAVMDAAAACTAWPACGDGWSLPTETDGWIAVGHRIAAVIVGLLVVATTVLAWTRKERLRVRAALLVSCLLYPAQAGLGAVVAVEGASATTSAIHLAAGVVIFAGLLAALAWWLETETGDPDDQPSTTEATLEPSVDDYDATATEGPTATVTASAPETTARTTTGTTTGKAGTSTKPPTFTDSSPATGGQTEQTAQPPTAAWPRMKATAAAYFRLMKPRLMWLLCLVAAAAMALAGGAGFTAETVAKTLVAGSLAIGASGTFNHVLERDIDRKMQRTSDRPLAVDLVPVRNAVGFGLLLTGISVGLFWTINLLAAALGLLAILFYSVVYTLILKPNTVQNTVIGGAAGALPALIGWAAVTGTVGSGGLLLAALIFLWTPAHFYNLALAYQDDYERGGFPMMPVIRGETTTRRHIIWYLGATLVAAAVLGAVADALGTLYIATGVLLGGVFLWAVVKLHYEQTQSAALRAFHASNAYLGLLLLAVVFDALLV